MWGFTMRKTVFVVIIALLLTICSGCSTKSESAQIAATTLPVYQFTSMLCQGTDLKVARLVTESTSCLHDYSLNVNQVKTVESAELIVMSGAGLEDFMSGLLDGKQVIDASKNITLREGCNHHEQDVHAHETDPHIWLSVANAKQMAKNIYQGLCEAYPEQEDTFKANMSRLMQQLQDLDIYARRQLHGISSTQIITFHDGFGYLADAYGLTILASVEEESGSEASSQTLVELINLVRQHDLKAIFAETNGSDAAAKIISAETGVNLYMLDMAMSGNDYFESMYRNIDTLREALR